MSTPNQSELFSVLAELARRYPDWRLGQLVTNVAGWADQDIWDVEDQQLLEAAKHHLEELSHQTHDVRA